MARIEVKLTLFTDGDESKIEGTVYEGGSAGMETMTPMTSHGAMAAMLGFICDFHERVDARLQEQQELQRASKIQLARGHMLS